MQVSLSTYNLDTIHDAPRSAGGRTKDSDDLELEDIHGAIDSIERAVQHGNIAGARQVLQQLMGSKLLRNFDVEALTKLIDDAESDNPIADISKCRAPDALNFVTRKGGKIISDTDNKGVEEPALMMADFDHDTAQADGRGRGLAALKEIKEGEVLLEVPASAHMSVNSAADIPELDKIFRAEGVATVLILIKVLCGKGTHPYRQILKVLYIKVQILKVLYIGTL
jgi:hypothetical protein